MLLQRLQKASPGPGLSRSGADPSGNEKGSGAATGWDWSSSFASGCISRRTHRGCSCSPGMGMHLAPGNLREPRASCHWKLGKLQQSPKNPRPPLVWPVLMAQPGLDIFLKTPTKTKEEERGAMGKPGYLPLSHDGASHGFHCVTHRWVFPKF